MFSSREQAGKLLGEKLQYLASERPVVLGIARGGVVVAVEVAKALKAPLYPLVVKKISSAWNPEFAVGAMGPDGKVAPDITDVTDDQIKDKRDEIKERVKEYGVGDLGLKVKNRTVVIVDDGIATGWTVRVALRYIQGKRLKKVVVAVPVADQEIVQEFRSDFKSRKVPVEFIVLDEVNGLGAVGNFYEGFSPVSDEEVITTLKNSVDNFSVDNFSQR